MRRPLWNFIRNGKNRDIVSWLGGGSVVIVAGIWAAFTYFFPNVDKNAIGSPPTVITQSGPGIASGRDTVVNAPIAIGLDEKQVGRRVAEAQQPLTDQIEKAALRKTDAKKEASRWLEKTASLLELANKQAQETKEANR
jgi:hypothetical protein